MLSTQVKDQIDYKITMNLIQSVLDTDGPNGSIAFGKCYANKYKNIFDDMLSDKQMNQHVLASVKEIVNIDLTDVRNDCKRRIQTSFSDTNNEMMSMITDFVKSL